LLSRLTPDAVAFAAEASASVSKRGRLDWTSTDRLAGHRVDACFAMAKQRVASAHARCEMARTGAGNRLLVQRADYSLREWEQNP